MNENISPRGKKHADDLIDRYLVPLFQEIDSFAQTPYVQSLENECVFLGGGSPSMLSERQLELFLTKVSDSFDLSRVQEYSMEFELRTMTEEKLKICRDHGITRISFGWQTFVPHIRKIMALTPTEDELREKIELLRKYDFSINADLMFGMPEQTFDDWKNDVARALEFGYTGVDLFKTENVPPAPMYILSQTKNWSFLDSETKKDMFCYAIEEFERHGYIQDSFQRMYHPDHPTSRLLYNKKRALAAYDQVSFGPGSWGFIADRVYVNDISIDNYISQGDAGVSGGHIGCKQKITPQEYVERNFVQGLSHNMKLVKADVVGDIPEQYLEVLEKLKSHGLLEEDDKEYRLTKDANGYVFNVAHEFFSKESKRKSIVFFMQQRHGRKGKKREQKVEMNI